ncbi:hypothetical protein BCR35DRAFT_62651 [Leucosporidium creatinivorum]|uniref:Uncharacterized protein n=1 Tax=Leucosporidium creatinivorum TaxID=106004 RepID=A0A1Y2FLT3_9BASI|nr:hypothetical protein BCR35DRAFT_62651 [Leucosporidium creatinivorum]
MYRYCTVQKLLLCFPPSLPSPFALLHLATALPLLRRLSLPSHLITASPAIETKLKPTHPTSTRPTLDAGALLAAPAELELALAVADEELPLVGLVTLDEVEASWDPEMVELLFTMLLVDSAECDGEFWSGEVNRVLVSLLVARVLMFDAEVLVGSGSKDDCRRGLKVVTARAGAVARLHASRRRVAEGSCILR